MNFFVNQSGRAIVECPHCKNSKSISGAAYKGKKFTMNVKCPCGHVFPINLDFRKHYRKVTLLDGNYHKTNLNIESFYEKLSNKDGSSRNRIKNCTVRDLSLGGVGLDIWGNHTIEEGDELFLEFNLDTKRNSLIRCEVTVKTVRENFVGAEFKGREDCHAYLGFYLMS